MNVKVTDLRGTIFTKRIILDNNSLTKLLPLFSGFSVEMVPAPPEGPFPMPATFNWSLVNEKKDCRIIFANNTIDIIKSTYIDYTEGAVQQFAQFCRESYKAIYSQYGNTVSRMALAPTLKIELTDNNEFVALCEKIASTKKFKNNPVSTLSFSDVYRVKEDICGHLIMINYLSNFSSSENIENGVLSPIKEVVFGSDINTFQLAQNEFDDSHLDDFYQKVSGWYAAFYNFYFE